jgi:DNA-binding HxlR family transcriptional regulator
MTTRHAQPCSVSAALNIFGDAWTLIVVREAMYGTSRFSEFRRATGIARNILADRLDLLVAEGILKRINIGSAGNRYEYRLTEKGQALIPVLLSIIQWADYWVYGKGKEPLLFRSAASGKPLAPMRAKWADGEAVSLTNVVAVPGPGANQAIRNRFGPRPARTKLERKKSASKEPPG